MSRSYKKTPKYHIVAYQPKEIKSIKRSSSRAFRRALNQGRLDDEITFGKPSSMYKNFYYQWDLNAYGYATPEDDYYNKAIRK